MLKHILVAITIAVAWTELLPAANAQSDKPADPLFLSHETLRVTMAAPFATLQKKRPNDEYLPATWTYETDNGDVQSFGIGVRTRGNYRRETRTCPFPPLRLDFDKSEVRDTLFDHQNKLKLVTHCRDGRNKHEQFLLRELVAYRIFNELTDMSFRVRLLRITYVDTEGKYEDRERYGFLIEDAGRLAKRIDKPELVTQSINFTLLDGAYSELVSVFQFMIGNTDFSQIAGADEEDCCHNSKLFGDPAGPVVSIPYDFDLAGLVNASYATPNPRFGLRSVTQRLYRGICDFNVNLDDTLQTYRDSRDAIVALIEAQPGLDDGSRDWLLDYTEKFYRVIDDPRQVERQILNDCR